VGEKEHLISLPELRQQPERRLRPRAVEMDENVVRYERKRLGSVAVALQTREPKCEEQLVARPVAHLGN